MSEVEGRCPRCGGAFHCGATDSAPCPCTRVTLDARTLAELRARYDACLCMSCLVEFAPPKGKAGPV